MKSKHPFTHKVTIQLSESNKGFLDWLLKEHGPGGIHKVSRWNTDERVAAAWKEDGDPYVVAFREPQHATAFALKWV